MKEDITAKEIDTALGEPFAIEFSEYVRKIRNNLMFLGVLSITLVSQNLKLDPKTSSIVGLKFDSLNMDIIYTILFWLTLYSLIHFIWSAWDYYKIWKLRLTGTSKVYEGGFGDELADNKNDPSQTTLYFWWMSQYKRLDGDLLSDIKLLKEHLLNEPEYRNTMGDVNKNVDRLNNNLDRYISILSSDRVPMSLHRFNNEWKNFQNSQNYRWLILELLFPVLIGISALYILGQTVS